MSALHDLPFNSDLLVWRENSIGHQGEWSGPFKLLFGNSGSSKCVDRETCKVQLPHGPTNFRSTTVKPFYTEPDLNEKVNEHNNGQNLNIDEIPTQSIDKSPSQVPVRRSERIKSPTWKLRDADLSVFLQSQSFADSRRKEINDLLEKGVFKIIDESSVPQSVRILNSRFVFEIKKIGTDKAFEKSRLVVQAFNDHGKEFVLTQSPTIQRMSQRLTLALTATLHKKMSLNLFIRDISQTYVQSTTQLNRNFFVNPPKELGLKSGSILKIVKPLYGVPEAGNHWLKTYH
ncbi:hypothetical protein K3495_g14069 [Podosphaera aphanis]|nr:hypothetical protein K3495_g14069 [Podosphaera aphanis]